MTKAQQVGFIGVSFVVALVVGLLTERPLIGLAGFVVTWLILTLLALALGGSNKPSSSSHYRGRPSASGHHSSWSFFHLGGDDGSSRDDSSHNSCGSGGDN